MTRRIYMDNAATSFPKPPVVLEAMTHYATQVGASAGRGAYAEAREAGELIDRCRQRINQLIGGEDPNHVIFTLNTTDALNMAIRGLVHADALPGHVITTWLDHNSVLRPFNMLAGTTGLEQTRIACDPQTGLVDPDDIRKAIRKDTRLIAVVHGSNVTGTVQPIRDIGRIAREAGVPFLVDAAQTLGHLPLHVREDCIDLLAFPGHKGLLGPLGTGGLYIRPGLEKKMRTVREGGTGSKSDQDIQPDFMPDRFEPGSHNAIGIVGLSAGVQWILDRGVDQLWQHEQKLIRLMLDGLAAMAGLTLYGPPTTAHRCGVFSIRAPGSSPKSAPGSEHGGTGVSPVDGDDSMQPLILSRLLEEEFGILTRSGIHCAPLAHKTVGTHHLTGTTRLSLGPFLTEDDVHAACDALGQICRREHRALV